MLQILLVKPVLLMALYAVILIIAQLKSKVHYIRAWCDLFRNMPVMFSHYIIHNKDIQHIEAVQRRADRFIVNCYSRYQSVSNTLQKLNWSTLEECRNELKLIMMYKIMYIYNRFYQ